MLALVLSLSVVSSDAAALYTGTFDRWEAQRDDIMKVHQMVHAGLPVTPAMEGVLADLQQVSAQVHKAAAKRSIDWGLDYSKGMAMELPEVMGMRTAGQHVSTLMMVHAAAGDDAEVVRSFKTLRGMGEHVAEQKLLISSLVGLAIVGMADEGVAQLLDMGLVTRPMAAGLLPLYRWDGPDPYLLAAAVTKEREVMLEWLEKAIKSGDVQAGSDVRGFLGLPDNGMTNAIVLESIEQARAAYTQLEAAAAKEDADARVAALKVVEERAQNGEFGLLGSMLMPTVSRCFETRDERLASFAERREALRRIAEGEVEPFEGASRTWLWLLAARDVVDHPRWWTNEALAEVVDTQLLRSLGAAEGVWPEPWGEPDVPVPWWMPGQWRLLEGITARALAAVEAGRSAAAMVDVQLALQMIVVSANDGRCAPSVMAAHVLPVLSDLVERLHLSDVDVTPLAPLVRRLPTVRDPAGLIRAFRKQEGRLRTWVDGLEDHHRHIELLRSEADDRSAWPDPQARLVTAPASDAAGLVVSLAAVMDTQGEPGLDREPVGDMPATAPACLQQTTWRAAIEAATGDGTAASPLVLQVPSLDPGEAAHAVQRLRDLVLQSDVSRD